MPDSEKKKEIKGYFEAGDIPTAQDFSKLIDLSTDATELEGTINADRIPDLSATKVTTDMFAADRIPDLSATKITTDALDADRIPDLSATKITTDALAVERIPDLSANKITADTLGVDRIPELSASKITTDTLAVDRIPDLSATKITTDALGAERIPDLSATKITTDTFTADRIPDLSASKITADTLDADRIPVLSASKITADTLDAARIPELSASKITTDMLDADRIPDLSASKITADTLDADRIPALSASKITADTLDADRIPALSASKITADTLDADRIPALSASKITTDTLDAARIPELSASKITADTFTAERIPDLSANKITGDTLSTSVLPDATTDDKGSVQLATAADVLLAESPSLVMTPASSRSLIARMVWPSSRSKKNEVPFSGAVNGYKNRGMLPYGFTYNDYVTTQDGSHLLLTKGWNTVDLRVLRWDGAYFTEVQTIASSGQYSKFRLMNFDGVTVLYDGNRAYTWKAQTATFEETGLISGFTFTNTTHAHYGVAYDGLFRVAIADRLDNCHLFTLDDPYQPHILTPVGEIPFAVPTEQLASSNAVYRVLHLDGNPVYGLLATTIDVDSDQIRFYRVQPGTSTIDPLSTGILPTGGLYTAGQLVYQDSAQVIIAHAGNEYAGKVHSLDGTAATLTATDLGSYDQLSNGGDIKLFSVGTQPYMMIQEGPVSSEHIAIYQLDGAGKTKVVTLPNQITSASGLALAVFDDRLLIINGNEQNVFELIIE